MATNTTTVARTANVIDAVVNMCVDAYPHDTKAAHKLAWDKLHALVCLDHMMGDETASQVLRTLVDCVMLASACDAMARRDYTGNPYDYAPKG